MAKHETTDQLQAIGFGVLAKVFLEADMTGGVEEKRERVVCGGIDPEKTDNVWVGELVMYLYLSKVPLNGV